MRSRVAETAPLVRSRIETHGTSPPCQSRHSALRVSLPGWPDNSQATTSVRTDVGPVSRWLGQISPPQRAPRPLGCHFESPQASRELRYTSGDHTISISPSELCYRLRAVARAPRVFDDRGGAPNGRTPRQRQCLRKVATQSHGPTVGSRATEGGELCPAVISRSFWSGFALLSRVRPLRCRRHPNRRRPTTSGTPPAPRRRLCRARHQPPRRRPRQPPHQSPRQRHHLPVPFPIRVLHPRRVPPISVR